MKPNRLQEISNLYHAALDLPVDERETFLKTCADEDMRREVQAMLADETKLRDFLENPALEVAGRLKTTERPSLSGTHLGSYHIVSELGRGGMGEVYRAKDRKLQREVAIKVLPEEFAKDADRVSRFQREARLLAFLNHPNIAAIHGLEESSGKNFLVLELVEGETLREQLNRGPIPVEESLKLAVQIAEALEAAHEKGVIHRDLKPANIKVTPDGILKVLDFGLAKAFAAEPEANLSNSPTLSNAATKQGIILGTAAYMSPEQARGKSVDKRTDIWAFGCLLFEMLTGRAAFQGEDVSEILASVIKGDLHLDLLPANIHPRIRELLSRCIQKDLKKRYRDIGDVQFELEQVLADPGGLLVQPITTVEHRTKLRAVLPWIAAALVLGALIAGVSVWKLRPTEPRQVIRLDHDPLEGQQYSSITDAVLAASPDGKKFAYSTTNGLYLRSVDELTAKLIPGTEGYTEEPFFSPDGKWIGYFSGADRKLKKVAVTGGIPAVLCDVVQLDGAWWSADSTIVYGRYPGDIMRISANGGTPESIVEAKSGILQWPQVLPDGKSVLYTVTIGNTPSKIMIQSIKSGEPKELLAGVMARYLQSGHIVYMRPDNFSLLAVPFDLDRLEVTGEPVAIVENVFRYGSAPQYAVSNSGTLVYMPDITGVLTPGRTLVWVDRNGKEEPIAAPPNFYGLPKISPDGTRLALTVHDGVNYSIFIWNFVRETLTRLTFDEGSEYQSVWTPDGKRIVYASSRAGVCWRQADGTGEAEQLASLPDRVLLPWSFSSDGKTLVSVEAVGGARLDIGMMSMEGDHARKPLLQEKHAEVQPKISPDGRWMAYASTESDQNTEVYVRPFPDVDRGIWQVSTGGGSSPLWSPDGRELFYLSNDNSVMAGAVETKPTFSYGTPKSLFRSIYAGVSVSSGTPWDIAPDGKRFLMLKPPAPTDKASTAGVPRPKINIVLNWIEELKQRVPIK
jgi:eukaryotic-like serine/threonine-protein kinase